MNNKTINIIKSTLNYPQFMPLDSSAVICIEVGKLVDMMNDYANTNGETIYTESDVFKILEECFFERTGFSYAAFPEKFERIKKLVKGIKSCGS